MSKIKFAVVGCGHIGKRHASMILGNDNAINAFSADQTGSQAYTAGITNIADNATINESTNVVLIQPSGSRVISGSYNNGEKFSQVGSVMIIFNE